MTIERMDLAARLRRRQGWASVRKDATVSFFEPPPQPPEPEYPEMPPPPPWLESPKNELGAPVPVRLLLARTGHVAVALVGATAYSTGVTFSLFVRSRRSGTIEDVEAFFDPFGLPLGHPRRGSHDGGELRFGVQFSDGRKATTVGGTLPWASDDEEPAGPVLQQGGGGGSNGDYESKFWLWPLPPPGPVTFAVEWPAREIELSKQLVDAGVFIEASKQSEVLWAEEDAQGPATQSSTFRIVGRRRDEPDEGAQPPKRQD